MQHEDGCRVWDKFHPYDCPDCELLNEAVGGIEERIELAVDEAVDEAEESGRADGYAEGQRVTEDAMNDEIERLIGIHEDELEKEFIKGYNQGFVDGRNARENAYS
jgi:flagellar biosynthesis/type III secretory pathway protein FliH